MKSGNRMTPKSGVTKQHASPKFALPKKSASAKVGGSMRKTSSGPASHPSLRGK